MNLKFLSIIIMYKHLFRTALWLMGLMGTLAIWVVNAETTITHYTWSNISYTLNWNELFTWVWTITITDWTDTITILDRNLWAKKAWTGCKDRNWWTVCAWWDDTYGYHFQRGNNYWFDPNDSSINVKYVSSDWAEWDDSGSYNNSWYYGSTFIEWDSSHWYDYWKDSTSSSSNHENLRWWGGDYNDASNWFGKNNENRRWPCPEWFHVPSYGELQKLQSMLNADGKRNTGTLHNELLIPVAGYRGSPGVSVYGMGSYGELWSSSPYSASDPKSRILFLNVHGSLNMSNVSRADALSVRCFYDSYQPFTQSFTLTFGVSDDNGSTSAETGSVASGTVIVLSTGDFEATKDGWTHLWWNTDASATGVLESITMTEDTTVYAIFSKDLTVNYATWAWVSTIQKESDSCSMYNTGTSCALTVPDITEDKWYENWVWKKWNDTVNPWENITLTSTSDGDIYTATASAKEFAIRFVDSNQQNVDVIYSWAYKSDTSNITYPSWTRDGYTISWDKPIPATMPLNGDTITANWTENKKPSWGSSGWGGRSKTDTDSSDKSNESQTWNQTDSDSSTWSQDDNTSDKHTEWQNYSEEFQEAYEFAKEKWITTMPTINDANMNWKLTRIAMAKMLSYYAINVLWQKPDETRINKFNDITEELDKEYDSGVTLAYQLWIMWINMPNNKFRPNDEVTRAEFATALSRMLYGTPDWNPYYSTHLAKLKAEWILKNDDYKMKELRWYVMIMLMRSAK